MTVDTPPLVTTLHGGSGTLEPGKPGTAAPDPPLQDPRARVAEFFREMWVECWRVETWPKAAVLRVLVVFVFAAVCSWLGIALSRKSEGVATIWLSNGVMFGFLVTQPVRRWPVYFMAGLTADTAADMVYGDPFRVAFGVSVANLFEVVNSSVLLTLLFRWPLDLSKRRPLVGFLLVSVVGATALTSAMGASWTEYFVDAGPWAQLFRTWYLGDLLGMAILGPLIVIMQRPLFFSILKAKQLPRTVLILASCAAVNVLVFTHNGDPLIFLLFPAFLLVAFRLGLSGTVLNILLTALLAIGFTVAGHGPLMLIQGEHMMLHRIVVAQIFVAVAIFTMLPVAALLEEREGLKASLAASEAGYRALAHADELTGLRNRRAFNLQIEKEWELAQAQGSSLGLLLLDADFFKQYNDIFGHLRGDDCLRCVAGVIADVMKDEAGTAARFGGEEFAVILPGADMGTAVRIAERIRAGVAGRLLEHPSSPFGVQTLSLGVALAVPARGESATKLVMEADRALYLAKIAGRNRVSWV